MRLSPSVRAMMLAGSLAGCSVGPDYDRPPAPTSPGFKELARYDQAAGPNAPRWQPAAPGDEADRGKWWLAWNDPVLDRLERLVDVSNQTLKESEAAFRQARAMVEQARAGYFPTVSASAGLTRTGGGNGASGGRGGAAYAPGSSPNSVTSFSSDDYRTELTLSPTVSWDIDVWGKIRRTVEADVATAQASAADLANARLSAQAELATAYFQLRVADDTKRLLDDTVTDYRRALDITQRQYRVGFAARSDVVQAETQLATAQAQDTDLAQSRAQDEHAIAVLIGEPPALFSLAPVAAAEALPAVPRTVPSLLLERRPDIAAAERRMQAANAQIGVAIAAYYPDLTISASADFASNTIGTLLHAANTTWSAGGTLAETIFDAGLRDAQLEAARASYDQAVATYRQTVLTGFQQVEDNLAIEAVLAREAVEQDRAVAAAREAERLLLNQYRAGTVAYTSVITAETAALSDEQRALAIRQTRLTADVALIEALGGGWQAGDLPKRGTLYASDALYASDTGLPAPATPRR